MELSGVPQKMDESPQCNRYSMYVWERSSSGDSDIQGCYSPKGITFIPLHM